jgi:hypothetical protein
MRLLLLAAPALLMAAPALGQTAPIRSEPLPPLQQQWQQEGSPPVQQSPTNPNTTSPGATDQDQQFQGQLSPPAAAPPAPLARPSTWLPATVVKLQALDKVNAQTAALTIKVGTSATFGSLTIAAKACVVRPSDQPADAAAFLAVTDSHPDAPAFNGWMLQDEPSVSMMEHPIYDLRVIGCA